MDATDRQRAFGLFSNREAAENALNELKASGFSMEKVSIIAKEASNDDRLADTQMSDRLGNKEVGGATAVIADAITGSTWGTILVGLTSLALPGIGPVLAAGSLGVALVTSLAGVVAGTVNTNGVVNALTDLGIPEEKARNYSDQLLAGDYFAIVEGTADEIQRSGEILSKNGIQDWAIF